MMLRGIVRFTCKLIFNPNTANSLLEMLAVSVTAGLLAGVRMHNPLSGIIMQISH